MRNKSTYIILIIILVVFFIVMFVVFGIDNLRKESYKTVIITGDNTAWILKKKNWRNIEEQEEFQELNWKKYKVFSDNKEIGDYLLWHDDKWYAFDDKRNSIDVEGNLFAYQANYDIKVLDTEEEEVENDDLNVITALQDNNISLDTDFTSKYKMNVDYDNDGVEESFYVISNAFSMENETNTTFSIVFMAKDDKIYYVYRDVGPEQGLNGCKPYLKTFLDIDADNKYEFILGCSKFSVQEEINKLYQEKDGKFKMLVSS